MAATYVLGTYAERRVGSSPTRSTIKFKNIGVAEWLKVSDSKSDGEIPRGFESYHLCNGKITISYKLSASSVARFGRASSRW